MHRAVSQRRNGWARSLAVAALCALAPTAFASDAPARYAVEAEMRPLAVSACGRFAVEANARYTPEEKSADGRFALKAVHVPEGGCEAFPDPLFSNGFEGP
jgi:hypothetical protein